jgi:hypothetical protein
MKLERTYDLDDDDALARLHALTDYWAKKYGIRANWSGSTVALEGKALGVKFQGEVRMGSGRIAADVDAGFLAEKLGARRYVESKLDDYLSTSNSLESLRARIPG